MPKDPIEPLRLGFGGERAQEEVEIWMPKLSKQKQPVVTFERIVLPPDSGYKVEWVIPGARKNEKGRPDEEVWEVPKGYLLGEMTVQDVLDDWDI